MCYLFKGNAQRLMSDVVMTIRQKSMEDSYWQQSLSNSPQQIKAFLPLLGPEQWHEEPPGRQRLGSLSHTQQYVSRSLPSLEPGQ